jgi:quinoprotein glucose dehydrogenase
VAFPGNIGGIAWGGAAVDPKNGLIYLNTNNLGFSVQLIPAAEINTSGRAQERVGLELAPQRGTPYGLVRGPLLSPSKTPCVPPPWGTLAAVEINTGKIRWQVPIGRYPLPKPLSPDLGSITFAGPIVTASGLIFDVSPTDNHLYAFDAAAGKLLWQGELPVPSAAMPMTYTVKGKQYVVIAAGGHAKLSFVPRSDTLVAFSLP